MECIGSSSGTYTVSISDFDAVNRRIAVDDGIRFRAAHAGVALETVGKGTANVNCKDLAVGKFNYGPAVVTIAVLGKFTVDSLLSYSGDPINLFLGICEARRDVQVISTNINLRIV